MITVDDRFRLYFVAHKLLRIHSLSLSLSLSPSLSLSLFAILNLMSFDLRLFVQVDFCGVLGDSGADTRARASSTS